jgi:hypothetical protein
LQLYSVALENPPLLVVSDTKRFRIYTNWTNTVQQKHEFRLDEHLQLYREASQMLGLTGQFAFALFPALQIWIASPPSARGKEIQ